MRLVTLVVLAAVPGMLLACGKHGSGGAGDGDGGGTGAEVDAPAPTATDAANLDAATCATPAACDWIEPYQRDIVGRLAGAQEIAPGVRLGHRANATEREHARVYLIAELTRLGYTAERHAYRASGTNVVAYLAADAAGPGAGLIVVGAHFDSVPAGPGAADNATGVAIVLTAARYLIDRPGRRHPVAFVLFDEEEIGLIGSRAYAERLLTDQVPVTAAHCFDMLSFDLDADQAIELWSPVAGLEAAYRAAGAAAGVPIQPVRFGSSDHTAFLERSLPAVGIGEEFVGNDHTPHYHRSTDTFDKVDFSYLARATRVGLDVIAAGVATP